MATRRRPRPPSRIELAHAYLDAGARLVAGAPTYEAAIGRDDLTAEQRAALRVMTAIVAASIGTSPASRETIRTLSAAVATYAEHADKDLAYWRAAMRVEQAVRTLAALPPGAAGIGVASWLARVLGAEVDRSLATTWIARREDLIALLRRHTARRAKGKLTTAAIVATLLREARALGHRADARGTTLDHATQAVQKAIGRYMRR